MIRWPMMRLLKTMDDKMICHEIIYDEIIYDETIYDKMTCD